MMFRTCKERATYGFSLLAILTLPLVACLDGRHETTEVFPVCQVGPIKITASQSESYYADQVIDVSVGGKRIGSARVDQPQDWELLVQTLREEVNSKEKKP